MLSMTRRQLLAYMVPAGVGTAAVTSILISLLYLSSEIINYRMQELEQSLQRTSRETFFSVTSGLFGELALVANKIATGEENESTDRTEALAQSALHIEDEESTEGRQRSFAGKLAESAIRTVRILLGKPVLQESSYLPKSPGIREAYALERKRDYRSAIDKYDQALREEPGLQAEITLHQGYCWSMAGEYTRAMALFAMVKMLFPGSEQAQLAMALYQQVEALEQTTRRVLPETRQRAPSIKYARRLFVLRKFDDALDVLRTLPAQSGDPAGETRFLTARCYEELGKITLAIKEYNGLLKAGSSGKWTNRTCLRLAMLDKSSRKGGKSMSGSSLCTGTMQEAVRQSADAAAGTAVHTKAVFQTASRKGAAPVQNYFADSSAQKSRSRTTMQKKTAEVDKNEAVLLSSYFQSAHDSVLRRHEKMATRSRFTDRQIVKDSGPVILKDSVGTSSTKAVIYRVIRNGVICRQSPSSKAPKTGVLNRSARVVVEGRKGDWLKVKLTDGRSVWVEKTCCGIELASETNGRHDRETAPSQEQTRWIITADSTHVRWQTEGKLRTAVVYAGEQVTQLKKSDTLLLVRTSTGVTGWIPSRVCAWFHDKDRQAMQALIDRGRVIRERASRIREQERRALRQHLAPIIAAARGKNEVERVLSRNSGVFMRRYEERLKKRPALRGTVRVSFLIRPDGVPDSVSITESTLYDEILEKDITGLLYTVQFKPLPSEAGSTRHEYVLPFVPVSHGK
jgi:tetratricopeptide (TPR) repeat protein